MDVGPQSQTHRAVARDGSGHVAVAVVGSRHARREVHPVGGGIDAAEIIIAGTADPYLAIGVHGHSGGSGTDRDHGPENAVIRQSGQGVRPGVDDPDVMVVGDGDASRVGPDRYFPILRTGEKVPAGQDRLLMARDKQVIVAVGCDSVAVEIHNGLGEGAVGRIEAQQVLLTGFFVTGRPQDAARIDGRAIRRVVDG